MSKADRYNSLLTQVKSLVSGESDMIANMANVAAVLHNTFAFWWTGFYIVRANELDDELVLGPFQGPVACTRIRRGKGVCGTAWERNETIIVPDVHQFKGHIACSSESNSEIVVPIRSKEGIVIAVFDIDSREFDTFDRTYQRYLEEMVKLIVEE